ncbi:MAG: HU family DNA-binding protein [Bacteroidales bacterium]|nr:HU family DNA-binding protein [Candidatus Physcousia equi]
MNNKILLTDLANGTATRSGLPKKDSEYFVRSFFELISQSLLKDKIVKVKGLGTFKVVEVEGRDSVNVNNGERIHISGHSKITFSPDSAIRDIVNRPFAAFESIILNDGVVFDPVVEDEPLSDESDESFAVNEENPEGIAQQPEAKPESEPLPSEIASEAEPLQPEVATDSEPLQPEVTSPNDLLQTEDATAEPNAQEMLQAVASPIHDGQQHVDESEQPSMPDVSAAGPSSDADAGSAQNDSVVAEPAEREDLATMQAETVPVVLSNQASASNTTGTAGNSVAAHIPTAAPAANATATEEMGEVAPHVPTLRPMIAHRPRYVVNHSPRFSEYDMEELDQSVESFSWTQCLLKAVGVLLLLVISYIAGSFHLFDSGCKPEPNVVFQDEIARADSLLVVPGAKEIVEEQTPDTLIASAAEEPKPETAQQQPVPSAQQSAASSRQPGAATQQTSAQPQQVQQQSAAQTGVRQTKEPQQPTSDSQPKSNTLSNVSNYPQLQGSAYEIVGVKSEHVVRVGESVNSIALKELGSKEFSRHIILLNHITNPDIINVGSRLKIPELRHR